MRSKWLSTASLLLMSAGFAAAEEPAELTLRVFDNASLSDRMFADAAELASRLYARIGVTIHWVRGDRNEFHHVRREKPVQRLPRMATREIDILIDVLVPGMNPGVLAQAYPFQGSGIRIHVAMMRVMNHSRENGVPMQVVLGLVLAHEVGHIMLGTDGHRPYGIMRPMIKRIDMMRPVAEMPFFDSADAEHLRLQISRPLADGRVLAAAK